MKVTFMVSILYQSKRERHTINKPNKIAGTKKISNIAKKSIKKPQKYQKDIETGINYQQQMKLIYQSKRKQNKICIKYNGNCDFRFKNLKTD